MFVRKHLYFVDISRVQWSFWAVPALGLVPSSSKAMAGRGEWGSFSEGKLKLLK